MRPSIYLVFSRPRLKRHLKRNALDFTAVWSILNPAASWRLWRSARNPRDNHQRASPTTRVHAGCLLRLCAKPECTHAPCVAHSHGELHLRFGLERQTDHEKIQERVRV